MPKEVDEIKIWDLDKISENFSIPILRLKKKASQRKIKLQRSGNSWIVLDNELNKFLADEKPTDGISKKKYYGGN